jgi:signal transduction histidine kinase
MPRRGNLLSRGQLVLAITLLLLVVALGSVVVLAYININSASSFQSGYVLTNLANVQQEIIQLHMETNRVLRDRSKNFEPLELQLDKLNKQLELARVEAMGDANLSSELRNIEMLVDHYRYELNRLGVNPTEDRFRSSAEQIDNVLAMLEGRIAELYGDKEIEFYRNIDSALELQRTSQALTVSLGGLLLLFGVLLIMSVGRSVSGEFQHAYDLLKEEVTERRRAEDELRRQNEYLAALHETSLALMNRLETEDLLEAIVTRAAQMLGTQHGYVYLVNPAKQIIERKVGVGFFAKSIGFGLVRGEGLAGHIWDTGMPLVVNNYNQWPNRTPTPGVQEHEIKAVMGVPLMSGQQIVGVLGLSYDRQSGRVFGDHEGKLLEGFGQLASIALDNARLFAEADQRALQVEALYRADQELYRHLELDGVLATLVDVAVDILKVDKSALLIWDDDHTQLTPKAARGFREETLARMSFTPDAGLVGQVASQAQPVVVPDTTSDRRVDWNITYPERIRSFAYVPVIIDDKVFGIFNVNYTEPHAFTDEDLRLILALAQRAASAIQNARLYEQAQQAATLEERQRLARELHDAVTQTLFSASIIADILPRLWDRNPDEGLRRVEELRELTRGALAEMRTLLLELRPTALSETPIGELLHQLGEATVGRARVPVTVTTAPRGDLPLDVKVAFYRIAQEALNNIAKHANARQVEVRLDCTAAEVRLCVCDDGVGFDPNHRMPDNLGLRIMHERASSIGARLEIRSRPGDGSTINVLWRPAAPPQPEAGSEGASEASSEGASRATTEAEAPSEASTVSTAKAA